MGSAVVHLAEVAHGLHGDLAVAHLDHPLGMVDAQQFPSLLPILAQYHFHLRLEAAVSSSRGKRLHLPKAHKKNHVT